MSRANRLRSTAATLITALFLVSGCGLPSATPASASTGTSVPPQATPSVSAVASSSPTSYEEIEPGTALAAGTYVLHYASIGGAQQFPTLAITFTVPDGWDRVLIDGAVWGDGMRVVFAVVDNLYVDPCEPNLGLRDPAVGPSVDDLATALGTVPGWEIIEADHDLYFGYPAVRLVLSGPADVTSCPQEVARLVHTLGFPGFIEAVAGNERQELWILEVNGARLVINAVSTPENPPADAAELQAILDSIHIEP